MHFIKLTIFFLLILFISNINMTGPFLYSENICSIKNDENFELNNYTPFKIHFDFSNLKLKKKDTKIKKSIIKSGNLFNQLLKQMKNIIFLLIIILKEYVILKN